MIRQFLLRLLGIADHTGRLKDLEKHFVTKRDETGMAVETLADVPLAERKEIHQPRGLSIQQRRQWLEETDGGRNIA